jgi:hypothetical protein
MRPKQRAKLSMPLIAFITTLAVVFLAGMLLPAMQGSGHPHPELQAIISVLFFLEYPARSWGLQDADVAMLLLRMATTLVCGSLLGTLAALCTKLTHRRA